jgi:uncharacterized metal-binding protein YceD (DUF177 family)
MNIEPQPEFSRPFNPEKLKANGAAVEISATPSECAALAERLGLIELKTLNARLELQRQATAAGPEVIVEGDFSAQVVQPCAVTLDPIESCVASRLRVRYMSRQAFAELEAGDDHEIVLDMDEDDTEPLPDGDLDLGELVAQYLALSLVSYPRKEGVDLSGIGIKSEDEEGLSSKTGKTSPFSVLKKLYDKG